MKLCALPSPAHPFENVSVGGGGQHNTLLERMIPETGRAYVRTLDIVEGRVYRRHHRVFVINVARNMS